MKSGKTKGGNEIKPSVMRITTSSVLLLDVPENKPMGTPIIIDNKTTPTDRQRLQAKATCM